MTTKGKTQTNLNPDQLAEIISKVVDQVTASNAKPSKNKAPKEDDFLEQAIVFVNLILGQGYHIRHHQGKHDFQESVRSTKRNVVKIMSQYGYSKEDILEKLS